MDIPHRVADSVLPLLRGAVTAEENVNAIVVAQYACGECGHPMYCNWENRTLECENRYCKQCDVQYEMPLNTVELKQK